MGLYFKNKTGSPVWVTYAYYSPGCEGGVDWSKKGWYHVLPGNTAKVWSGWAGGDKFFFFAEDDFGHHWSGPFFTFVPWNAFDWCWNTASNNGETVGFRKINTISWNIIDYTINLVL
jgi:hypothetical protein